MNNNVIYPTMVIRTQAETIELQEKEIERLNNDIKELLKENGNKEKVIIAQDNIIKEAKEEIEYFELQAKHLDDNIYLDEKLTNKLLEILDKVGEEK